MLLPRRLPPVKTGESGAIRELPQTDKQRVTVPPAAPVSDVPPSTTGAASSTATVLVDIPAFAFDPL
jgi:hypothetical protein